jgi:hypothetical protein
MNLNNLNLNSFLIFGYFLDYNDNNYLIDITTGGENRFKNIPRDGLVDLGIDLWKSIIQELFTSNEEHVVPISGGLDSRAILAGLSEFTDASNIHTFTFGTPGTYDYDIGNQVASSFGTRHTSFDLTKHHYNMIDLLKISVRTNHQSIPFHQPPISVLDELFSDHNVWSGYMGDPIAGSHLLKPPSINVVEAKQRFIDNNRFVVSTNLLSIDENEMFPLIQYKDKVSTLSMDEILDFYNRQIKYIAPHVLIKGFKYKLPFIHNNWVNYFLGVDDIDRTNISLYKDILIKGYPKPFQLPTKSNHALPLNSPRFRMLLHKYYIRYSSKHKRSNVNYIDYEWAIREKNDLKEIVYSNVMDLKARNIVEWIDIKTLWSNHINYIANHADALLVLASLEIHLKAQNY